MRTTNQETKNLRPSLYALALLALLALPGAARAQWTAPDASGNVNNTNAGNVGVGTGASAPAGKLDVKGGTSDASAPALTARNSSDSNLFFIRNDGRVGIGTTSPAVTFHLSTGATRAEANFQTSHTSGPILRFRLDAGAAADRPLGAVNFLNDAGTSLMQMFVAYPGTDNTKTYIRFTTSGAEALRIDSSGNVGIGTAAPSQRLQIGSNTITGSATPDAISLGATYSIAAGANPKLRLFDDNAGSVYGLGSSDHQLDFMVPATARYVWYVSGAEKMRLDASGNLGVGKTAGAGYKLDVNGSVNATGFCIGDVCKTDWSQVGGQWTPSGTGVYYNGGNVGIGTSTPLNGADRQRRDGALRALGGGDLQDRHRAGGQEQRAGEVRRRLGR
jgi:hypothetical protein